jgi:hypothetical protein
VAVSYLSKLSAQQLFIYFFYSNFIVLGNQLISPTFLCHADITRCISSGTIRSEVSMPISYSLCMNCKAILFGKFRSVPLSQLVF